MTTSENAYKKIKEMIISGELVSGKRISQLKLAKKLHCSTVPIVEALRRLESEGLISKEGRKMAKIRKLTFSEIKELYLVREALESTGARLCAMNITDEQIIQLRGLIEQFESAVDNQDENKCRLLEVKIHQSIATYADCSILEETLNRLLLIEMTIISQRLPFYSTLCRHTHRAVFEAIVDHDEDFAEYIMKKHIQNGYNEFTQSMKKEKTVKKRRRS